MLFQMTDGHRTRRRDERLAFGSLLVLDDSQAAIHFHLGLGHCRCSAGYCCTDEEGTAFRIYGLWLGYGSLRGIMQRVEFALVEAVAADHTTRVIHCAVLEVNGLGLAVLLAHATVLALVLVEADAEP